MSILAGAEEVCVMHTVFVKRSDADWFRLP
jgi:hypothetical protein